MIAQSRRTDPQTLARNLRSDLDWIVMKCLEKDRTRRYETASGLSADVNRYLAREPVLAVPPSRRYRLKKLVRRNQGVLAAGGAVATTLVLGLGLSLYGLVQAGHERNAAIEARQAEKTQRELAEKREKEKQQVSDFQAAMLSEIDVEAMGRGIKERFREQVRAALERQYVGEFPDRRKRTPEEIAVALVAFDERADAAQAVDVARGVMDEFVLARAADALEKQFADQPLVQAQLHTAIGSTYQAMGLYDAAEPHLRAALEIRERELGAEQELVADSLSDLGVLLIDKGNYDAAEPLLREALAMRRKLLGDVHPAVATSLYNLARSLAGRGDSAAAEPLYREALAMRRKLLGDESPDVVWTLKGLGDLLTDKRDYVAAEPLLREAVAGARKLWGDQHPNVANCINALAKLLDYQGDYAAESMFRDALAIARQAYGDEHPYVAASLSNLASALTTKGDYAAAEPPFREALAIRRKVFGDEHPAVELSLRMLATTLQRQGKYAAAEPLYREALAIRRKLLGNEHPEVANSLENLALLLKDQRDYAAAEPLLREALAIRRKLLGDEHPSVTSSLMGLASVLRSKKDYAAAEGMTREALDIARRVHGGAHADVALTLHHEAEMLHELGRRQDAEPLAAEAIEIYRAHPDYSQKEHGHAALVFARILRSRDDAVGCEALYREALGAYRESAIERVNYGNTRGTLAEFSALLQGQGRLAEAEPFLRDQLQLTRQQLPQGHPEVAKDLGPLIHVLLEQGRYVEAEPLARECLEIREKTLEPESPDYWLLASTRSMLGGALAGQGAALIASNAPAAIAKFTEAEPLLVEAGGWLTQNPDRVPQQVRAERLRQALEQIVSLYESWDTAAPDSGKADQAGQWRTELQNLP